MADSKWGGIAVFAEELAGKVEVIHPKPSDTLGKTQLRVTAELETRMRRRIEPLLEAAKEVHCPTSTLTEINRLRRLQEEVDKWR